jgi:hypothetical protein
MLSEATGPVLMMHYASLLREVTAAFGGRDSKGAIS